MALSVGKRTLTAILTDGATVTVGALASESGTLRGTPTRLNPARLTLTDQATANTTGGDTPPPWCRTAARQSRSRPRSPSPR